MKKKQLEPINLYERLTKNGKYISKKQLKEFIKDELSSCGLTQRQIYMIKGIYNEDKSVSNFMYEFGYKSTSVVSREIKAAVAIIRSYLNFKYATIEDPITYIVSDRVISESFDIETTYSICEVMALFESDGVHGRYNEIIFYLILRKFEFDSCNIFKLENKSKIPAIDLYTALYKRRPEPKFIFPEYQHLFVKNVQKVLHILGDIFPDKFIPSSIPVACQYLKSTSFYELMSGKLVERLVENPDMILFSEEYFDNIDMESCSLDYLKEFFPLNHYNECTIILKEWTLKGLFDWRLNNEFKQGPNNYKCLLGSKLTDNILAANKTVKAYYDSIWREKYKDKLLSENITEC